MATVILKEKYRCSDDCVQSGCPEHEMILSFQTVSNSYKVENGKGDTYYFEDGELSTLINLLKQLSERRVDAVWV
jgi:hypothetical protein